MATRINVTAIRDCPELELRAAMSEAIRPVCAENECKPVGELLTIVEHGAWRWFTTSVWGVSASDLNRGLCKLARPALQFTTSDGDRWYLTVHGGPRGQVHFVHEFGTHGREYGDSDDEQFEPQGEPYEAPTDPRLEFLEEPRQPRSRPTSAFDAIADGLAEMGCPVSDEFRESVAALSYSQAVNRFRDWSADQICNALSEASIPHDSDAVKAVLLWQNVTSNEHQGDLGNLPRLLSVLGLGGAWDECVRQAETPITYTEPTTEAPVPVEAQETAPEPTIDHFQAVLSIVERCELTAVEQGPFVLPLDDLTLTRFFVDALSILDTADVVCAVTLPSSFRAPTELSAADAGRGQFEWTSRGFRIGIQNHMWFNHRDLKAQLGKPLYGLLYHLPNDSVVDVAYALEGRPELTQRYQGSVQNGEWQISATYPKLTVKVLAGALRLARRSLKDADRFQLKNEAEAIAVIERARTDPNMFDLEVKRAGRTIWCPEDIVGHLIKVVFRQRYRDYWDVAAHDRLARKKYDEHIEQQRQFRRAGAEAARRRAAPHDPEPLYHGRSGKIWRTEFARLEQLEQETRAKFDAEFESLGFSCFGDLVAKKQRDIVFRVYGNRDQSMFGLLMAKRTMYLGYEFYSRFQDGSTLTTTTNASISSRPERKLYVKSQPGLPLSSLHEKHIWGVERFRSEKGLTPMPLSATLVGAALEIDRSIVRREDLAWRVRIVSLPDGEPPESIRAAWIGCELPVFATSDDERVGQTMRGVLTQQQVELTPGYAVQVPDALKELERHNPAAANWWREFAPHALAPGQLLLFQADVCELVSDFDE